MLRPKVNPFIVIWVIPDQNQNESLHETDCCNVLSDCWLDAPSIGHAAAAAGTGLWTEPQTAGEIVFFFLLGPVYVFFYKKNKIIWVFFIIFDSNYFKAIWTAVLYKKSTFKMFKCKFFMF